MIKTSTHDMKNLSNGVKKILTALVISSIMLPTLASADSFGIQPTLGQLLTRIAALQAILGNTSINCAVAATKTTVQVGEPFTIAWGSFGADPKYSTDPQNRYDINGEQTVQIDRPETRTYHFTFFGQNGTHKTCEQTITVIPRTS